VRQRRANASLAEHWEHTERHNGPGETGLGLGHVPHVTEKKLADHEAAVSVDHAQFTWLRSRGFFVYCGGNDRTVSGQQYSSSFTSPRRRPIMRT
jgi:hypothetical protein